MINYKLADLIRHSGVSDEAFLEVLDQVIKPSWEEGPWVAGGSIRRMLAGTDPLASDFDIFFRDPAQKDAWVTRMETDHEVLKKIENDFNTTLQVKVFITNEFETDEGFTVSKTKELILDLQAVHVDFYATPQAVIDSFDYTICQFVTDGVELSVGQYSLWDLARKKLVIHKITYAIASMRRMLKYGKQGFGICGGMMAEFLGSVVERPETIDMNFKYID